MDDLTKILADLQAQSAKVEVENNALQSLSLNDGPANDGKFIARDDSTDSENGYRPFAFNDGAARNRMSIARDDSVPE